MAHRPILGVTVTCAGLLVGTAAFAGPTTTMDAAEQATQDARQKLKQEILSTDIGQGRTIGSVLKDRELVDELDRQLGDARPVGGPRWLDERNCQVRVELPGRRVAEILGKASVRQLGDSAAQAISRRTFVSVGSSGQTERPARTEVERKLVPQQPPEWVNRTISAEAWSRMAGSPLMTAQAAEAEARRMLGQRVGALILGYSTTMRQAGEIDPSIAAATDRALSTAQVKRTDYGVDGSAKVRIEMNLQQLWDELNR